MILKQLRIELFRPEDEPIIFDRKNRKIYRIFREVQPGWKGLFANWPMRQTEHDWDLVDAVHHAVIDANTATISRHHTLVFSVRAGVDDPTVVAAFTVGNGLQMGGSYRASDVRAYQAIHGSRRSAHSKWRDSGSENQVAHFARVPSPDGPLWGNAKNYVAARAHFHNFRLHIVPGDVSIFEPTRNFLVVQLHHVYTYSLV